MTAERSVSIESDGAILEAGTIDLEINPARLIGSVVDEDARPISGVNVLLGQELTQTDSRGQFAFDGLVAGRAALLISADGYRPRQLDDVVLSAGEESALSAITLEYATGTLSGVVTLEGRSNYSGALIRAEHIASGEERFTLSEASGAWRLDNLRVGDYQVSISLADYVSQSASYAVIIESETSLEHLLSNDRGCFLGQVSLSDGADDYSQVSLTLLETVATTQADSTGRFLFDELIPGAYTVRASKEGYREAVGVTYVDAGESCEEMEVRLSMRDLQAPQRPVFTLAETQGYEPLAGASAEPWVIARSWDESGRVSIVLRLNTEDLNPYLDENFEPATGVGAWKLRANGSEPIVIPPFVEGEDHG